VDVDHRKDLTNRTPEAHRRARKIQDIRQRPAFHTGVFKQETVMAPDQRRREWGGLMTDPNAHLVFFNSERIVWITAVTENNRPTTPDSTGSAPNTRTRAITSSSIRRAIPQPLRLGAC
jgi:hypothetical protein